MEGVDAVDRISNLPDFIIHKILDLLDYKVAVQTSVLSKRWWECYTLYHNLDVRYDMFSEHLFISDPSALVRLPQERLDKISEGLRRMRDYIDLKFQRLHDQKLSIKRFDLTMTFVSNDLPSWLDAWIESAIACQVEQLGLDIICGRSEGLCYKLPQVLFTSNSIRCLDLSSCSLNANSMAIGLGSLRELKLISVKVDQQTINYLISNCPLIHHLSLRFCLGFRRLELCGLSSLKKLVYESKEVEKFIIEVPSLEELIYSSPTDDWGHLVPCEVYPTIYSTCTSLRRLVLTGVCISSRYLCNILSSSFHIEYLSLTQCVLPQQVIISSLCLTNFEIICCDNLVEAKFDTPNLHSFKYDGLTLPQLSSVSSCGHWVANVHTGQNQSLDTLWFQNLSSFIVKFQVLNISIETTKLTFNLEEFKGTSSHRPYQMEKLKVSIVPQSLSYASLLDVLLCNVRPKILHFELPLNSVNECLEELRLQSNEREPSCCRTNQMMCWRHYLEQVTVDSSEGIKKKGRIFKLLVLKLNW